MNTTERSAQIYSNLAYVLMHLSVILYATAVLHLPGVYNLPYGQMLGFASLVLILYGLAALPAGLLRWSRGRHTRLLNGVPWRMHQNLFWRWV